MDTKEEERTFIQLLRSGPEDQIKRHAATLLAAYVVDIEKSGLVPENVRADMWKGLDRTKMEDRLQVCKVTLEWAIAAGKYQAKEQLVKLHAIAHLGQYTTQEIQAQAPKVITVLEDPAKAVTEESLKERMRQVWKFLERLAIFDLPLGRAIAELVKGHPV
ncbi:hypothetical protein H2200_007541 [Cladophialophora chaetospira]|uniref:Uncharacterized protein n=1 Tax=Cladophialophora chaetospira TaxID=386627 RepID=A0AA38X855_9EURO|nr:hypothetical protein H2200_007541 [Cladophialophora chaetospira]